MAKGTSNDYKVELLPAPLTVLGEGPHWDSDTQNLYYNDIYGGTINRYDYNANKAYTATVENEPVISFIIPIANKKDEFAIGVGRRIGIVKWDGISATTKLSRTVGEVEKSDEYKNNRFNDAKADPTGRFYGGTMRLEEMGDIFDARLGSFYMYNKGTGFTNLITNIGVSNGLAWDETKNKFYFIDSVDHDVKVYDWDAKTGNITNGDVAFDFKQNGKRPDFVPDGMTIDTDGFLYVATFGGSTVYKIDPSKKSIVMEIKLPCEQVTSVAFGGPNLDILFATSAGKEFKTPQPPPAGGVFKITGLNAKGYKMTSVHL